MSTNNPNADLGVRALLAAYDLVNPETFEFDLEDIIFFRDAVITNIGINEAVKARHPALVYDELRKLIEILERRAADRRPPEKELPGNGGD